MNDAELDRLVAATAPVGDAQVAALDLRDAETELMERIMATPTHEVSVTSASPAAPAAPARRRRRRVRLAAAAVAALAAAAIVVISVHGSPDGHRSTPSDVSTQGDIELPHLIADPPPDGYPNLVVGKSEPVLAAPGELEQGYTVLYGDVGAQEPANDLVLAVLVGSNLHYVDEQSGEPLTVRGHDGRECAAASCAGSDGISEIRWSERPDLEITLSSRSFDIDQLVALAQGLVVEGDKVSPGTLPPGVARPLNEVGRLHDQLGGPAIGAPTVTYTPAGPDNGATPEIDDTVGLTMMPGGEADLAWEAWLAATRRPVTVRGHDGWLLTYPPEAGDVSLIWVEAPGVLASASVTSPTPDKLDFDLVGFAESLRPATDEEWQAHIPAPPADLATVKSHIPEDAQAYATTDELGGAAYLAADGQICGFMVDTEGKLPDTCGSADQRIHELRNRAGGVEFLFGTMPAGAVDVAASRHDVAEPMSAFHDVSPEDGPRIWILTTDMFLPETITFRDGNAQPVETVPYTP